MINHSKKEFEIYLDNAATTKISDEVLEVIEKYEKFEYANPSSPHAKGIAADKGIQKARQQIAKAFSVLPEEIIFTSGGTEANNLAIKGLTQSKRLQDVSVVCSAVEHLSVLAVCQHLTDNIETKEIVVDKYGIIDLAHLESQIDQSTVLVSIMLVNNEIGSVQPIKEASKIVKRKNKNTILHVDAVQAVGKVDFKPKQWGVDLFTLSAHKLHGPKGIGCLYVKKGLPLKPIILGGGQELGLRSGTENVPGIVGLGKCVEDAYQKMPEIVEKMYEMKQFFYDCLKRLVPDVVINGPPIKQAAPHILNVSIPKIKAEVLVRLLGDKEVFCSTGSACSTKKNATSHVLKALNLDEDLLDSSLRISLSKFNSWQQMEKAAKIIADTLEFFA